MYSRHYYSKNKKLDNLIMKIKNLIIRYLGTFSKKLQ